MLTTVAPIANFINNENLLLALAITIVITWAIALFTLFKARSLRKSNKPTVTEYEPPKELSPVLARYMIVSGRAGRHVGEISISGIQLLTLINLYEDGLLKTLEITEDNTVLYEVHENYKNMPCGEDEKIFLEKLVKDIGISGQLKESSNPESENEGYENLNYIWTEFWNKDLHDLALSKGYMKKGGKWASSISIFSFSLVFGLFVSSFLIFIPVIKSLAWVLALPVILLFAASYGISSLVLKYYDFSWAVNANVQAIIVFFGVFSWFIWCLIFGWNISTLTRRLTPLGLELVRKLEGYKNYLKSVDRDRLSFSFNKDTDFSRNRTSFSWLGIFGLLKDRHWEEWRIVAKKK